MARSFKMLNAVLKDRSRHTLVKFGKSLLVPSLTTWPQIELSDPALLASRLLTRLDARSAHLVARKIYPLDIITGNLDKKKAPGSSQRHFSFEVLSLS